MKPDNIDPTPAAVIADGITQISQAMKNLLAAGLKRKTIVVLIHASTNLPQRDITAVLDSLEALRADWCTI
jgi:siroheme synthase